MCDDLTLTSSRRSSKHDDLDAWQPQYPISVENESKPCNLINQVP